MAMACQGDWDSVASKADVSVESLDLWLEYAAVFLGNIGNYYVSTESHYFDGPRFSSHIRVGEIKSSFLGSIRMIWKSSLVSQRKLHSYTKRFANHCTPDGRAVSVSRVR